MFFASRPYLLAMLAVLFAAPAALAKPAVPPEAEVKAATVLIAEVYKKDYDAAKTPPQKQALAAKMLVDADKTTDDLTSAYALYQVAQKIAAGIGDVETAMQISERVASRFEVDQAEMERKLYVTLAPAVKTPLDHFNLTRYIGRTLPALVKERQFDDVAALLDLALDAARKSKDAELQKYWAWKGAQLKAQASAWTKADAALATLKT